MICECQISLAVTRSIACLHSITIETGLCNPICNIAIPKTDTGFSFARSITL